jgi:protein SCO1/2
MNKKFVQVWGIAIAAVVILITILQLAQPYEFRGALIDPAQPAPQIELPASTGGTFRLSDYQGKVVLLFFGYTSCPDVCPTTLGDMKQVRERLSEEAEQVQVVFVTVDPQRDTAERLASYLSLFDPSDIGLTGSEEQLDPVWQAYGVYRAIDTSTQTATGYLVDHSSRVYLIDRQGNLRLTYAFGTAPADIAADVAYLLKN